jgi:APA family basic amino acid/polyamine antiporter
MNTPGSANAAKPHLSLWDTVSIIVGIVIGAGIYETAPLIFQNVSGPGTALAVWAIGGALSLVGALCYAELATAYPRSGGDYTYLSRAYGSWAGFLFGWSQLAVLMTGSIGMMAYIFADYAVNIRDFGGETKFFYAAGAVVALTLANIAGLLVGKRTQNTLTALKVLGLAAIFVAALLANVSPVTTAVTTTSGAGSLGLAMILVLYTYGGWNDAALVSSEVEDKKRNIPRALILGTLSVAAIYLVINVAYLMALDFDGARQSKSIAAEVLGRPLGGVGAKVMSALVMVSALGAVNGMIYTGSRIYSTVGEDYRLFSWLAWWDPRKRTPVRSLMAQMLIAIALMGLVGTQFGRRVVSSAFAAFGGGAVSWSGHGGFDTLLQCTSPVFWLFFGMTAVAVIVLRFRDTHTPRPFKVPLYPLLPLVFCAMCAYMLYSAANYAGKLIFIGIIPLAAGLIMFTLGARSHSRLSGQTTAIGIAGEPGVERSS